MTPIQEEKKKKKKEEERIKEEIKKSIKKVKIDMDSKIEKKKIEEERLSEEIIQIKEEEIFEKEERKEELTDEERLMLLVLDFVDQHKGGLSITGFQIKDFLELFFPRWDVDEIYSVLKKKEFISKTRDSDEFSVFYKGRQEVEKHGALLESIIKIVGTKLEEFLKKNELLKRILYFAYKDNWRLRNFLPRISYKLNELEKVLMTFFLDESFLETPVVSKAIRFLRKEQPSQIKEMLMEYCKDLDFLKVLVIMRFDEIKDKIGIETIATLYYKSHLDILFEIVEKSKVKGILEKFLLLGITESENLFGIDVESVLMSEENISRLKEWMDFDEDIFKSQLEADWNLYINAKTVLENMTPFDFEELISTKAVLFHKGNILVRKEVKEALDEVLEKIKERLKNKVKNVENVLILPFYNIDREKLKDVKGKIIIVLHLYDWWSKKHYYPAIREDELENNVILLISPKEIGFSLDKAKIHSDRKSVLELPDKNVEFNAMGEFDKLEQVKSIFNGCEWVMEEEYYSVKRAKERIWEKEHPPISMEEAINELKKGIEGIDGKILIDALLVSVNIPTNYTAVFRNRDFDKRDLWQLIEKILILKYGIRKEQFIHVKERIEEIIEEKVRIDLLTLGLGNRPGAQNYYDMLKSIQEMIYQNTDIRSHLTSFIKNLEQKSKEILWTYLTFFVNSDLNINFSNFKMFYESIFNKDLGIIDDVLDIINKSGISIVKKIDNNSKFFIERPFSFIVECNLISEFLDILEQEIHLEIPQIELFIEKYEDNVIELIGLDFLLHSDEVSGRDELREILWKISLKAWDKFESYKGVITSKDGEFIAINPLILDELKEFVSARKREMIESQERLREMLLSLEIIDSMIEFDEDLFILKGFITLRNKEEINVILTPWYLPLYEKHLGEKTLIIITNQPDYKTLVKTFEDINKEITLVFLKNHQFYLFSKFQEIYFVNSLLTKLKEYDFALISKEIISLETLEELIVKQEPITPQVEKEESSDTLEKEELDLFGEFFDTDLKGFPIGLGTEDPVVLILSKTEDDDYSAMLQIMCRELYRELIKGLPRPKRITEEKIEEETDVSDRIIFVDDNKSKELGLGKISTFKDVNWIYLGKKLQEFFSRYFGFYIFEIPSDKMKEFKRKLEKYTKNLRPRIIQIFPVLLGKGLYLEFAEEGIKEISDLVELKRKICSIIWGFVTPKGDDRWEQGDTFDNFFTSCENEYKNRLRNLEIQKIKVEGKEISVPNLVKSVRPESDIHFQTKIFIVKYLYEIEKYSKDSVRTEQKIDVEDNYPDVQVGNVVFEVETLYNSERPRIKIAEKVKNYKNKGKKVIIVLKNVDAFLYYKHLIELEEELKEEENIDVEFKTLNLKDNILVHIKEIGKLFRSLFERSEFKKSN